MPSKPAALLTEWIENQLSSGAPGDRLPTEAGLARTFGLSVSTVKRTLKKYVALGRIIRIQGKGTFLPQPESAALSTHVPVPRSSVRSLADALYRSICRGDIKYGEPLPQAKYLRYRFRVTNTTVAAACRELAARGIVTRIGKTYWVGPPKNLFMEVGRQRSIVFFNYDSYDFTGTFRENLLARAHMAMERELSARGFYIHYENSRDMAKVLNAMIRKDAVPYGIILDIPELGTEKLAEAGKLFPELQRILQRVTLAKPNVLLELHNVHYHREIKARVSVLARGHILTSSARVLSQYLVRRGWDRAAFFLEKHARIWGVYNLEFPFVRIIREIKRMNTGFRYRVFYKSDETPGGWFRRRRLDRVLTEEREDVDLSYRELGNNTTFTKEFSVCFKEALQHSPWIFTNAETAARAVAWAKRNRVKIPAQCSIISLEDDPLFYHLGLTYCGPDWENIGYLLAHSVIGDFPVAKTSRGFIRTTARVQEKLTTPGPE